MPVGESPWGFESLRPHFASDEGPFRLGAGRSPRGCWHRRTWGTGLSVFDGALQTAAQESTPSGPPAVTSHTVYRTFNTDRRREFVRITEDVADAVRDSGITEGMVLVSAMHITAGVWINDDEPGIQADALEWLDKIAPPSWHEPDGEVARELLPNPATTATTAVARTTATPTSRTCSSTTR